MGKDEMILSIDWPVSTEGTIWKGNAFVQAQCVPEWDHRRAGSASCCQMSMLAGCLRCHRCLSAALFVADILRGTPSQLPLAWSAI